MRGLRMLILALLSCWFAFSAPAFGQEKAKKKKPAPKAKVVEKVADDDEESGEETPAADTKKLGVALNVGLIHSETPGGGAEGWYQVGQKLTLGGQVLSSSSEVSAGDGYDIPAEYAKFKFLEFGPKMRWFAFGGKFFVASSLTYATISGDYGLKVDGEPFTAPFDATAILLNLGVGNQWRLDNGLTFGADWLTLTAILSSTVKSEDDDAEFDAKVKKVLQKRIQAHILVAQFGFRF